MTPKRSGGTPAAAPSTFDVPLPAGYDVTDVLEFHGRDLSGLAEQVRPNGIRKGILLADIPAVIDIEFEAAAGGVLRARCAIAADGVLTAAMLAQARAVADSMLGLRLDPAHFAACYADDPVFGPLTRRQHGLRVVQAASVFEALTWAIIGQQINVKFAITLRHTLIEQAGRRHSSGLWCYPSAHDVAAVDAGALTARQFSRSKADTILRLAALIDRGELDLAPTAANTLDDICAALLAVKGIGPWTVNYALLRGYAHADCSLHGDVAVRNALQTLFGGEERPTILAAEQLLAAYRPHRTMAAAHLWASLKTGLKKDGF